MPALFKPSTSLPWRTLVQMTRPGFLVITGVACVLGTSVAMACGHALNVWKALITLMLALLMHAAANVLNDYHDALNGADAVNHNGLFPFTGGARLIQNGHVTLADTRQLFLALIVFLIPCGLWLAVKTGGGLILLGLAGLFSTWAYSAPPLALMKRGLGELTVGLTWILVVVGADYVQRGSFFFMPWVVAFSLGLLVANILVINGFPDAQSDAQVGKRTLVVRAGPRWAAWIYLLLALMAYAWTALGVWLFIHPEPALWGLVSMPLSLAAFVLLFKYAYQPKRLTPAIVLTITAAVLHGVAMAAGLIYLL
jgi:1,4-dihydroxy-2-naphthoate polyprenyltransferase